MKYENSRVSQIKSSPSMVVAVRAKQLMAEGKDIIDLSLGEPDMDTPVHILQAAENSIYRKSAHYTEPNGMLNLRQAIVGKLRRNNQLNYDIKEITVANGAKQVIFNALMATLELNDEVIIPAPYWVSYTDIVKLHGGASIVIPCGQKEGFKLTAERLSKAITPNTRWLMLNSPCNPSGAVYSQGELAALGEVLKDHPDILIMSDEIYEHILIENRPFISFAKANPCLKERILLVNGVSKVYAMTGWRVGYAAGPEKLIAAISKLQSQSVTSVSQIAQEAAIAALSGPQDFIEANSSTYRVRAELFVAGLSAIEGMRIRMPQGAFYAYPDCSQLIGRKTPEGKLIDSDQALATYLLEQGGVSCVPGSAFGLSPYLRFSVAASCERLEAALIKIKAAVGLLR